MFQFAFFAQRANLTDFRRRRQRKIQRNKVDEMLKWFDEGDQSKFISLWNSEVGKNMDGNIYGSKIEFYVRIYFTIYPMHSLSKQKWSDKVVKQRQKEFKKFLDTKGSQLSKTSEFLPYYALPYVPNPIDHPSFKQLFSTEWIKNLKEKLLQYLSNTIAEDSSDLSKIYASSKKPKSDDFNFDPDEGIPEELIEQINMLQSRCLELEKKEQNAKNMFIMSQKKWINFSRNILVITKQLMSVIDNSGIGDSINTIVYRSMKEKIVKYEGILQNIMKGHPVNNPLASASPIPSSQKNIHPESGMKGIPISPVMHSKDQSPVGHSRNYEQQMSEARGSPSLPSQSVSYVQDGDQSISRGPRTLPITVSLAPLDYDKIKKFLLTSEDELKIWSTLQALRWRISKSRSYSHRAEVLQTYKHYDILGITGEGPDLLIHLLNKSRRVLAYTVFLVNTMASEPIGRNYLIQYETILDTLFAVLLNEKQETAIRQQAVVAIQKFSLRTSWQNKMIEMDMIKYIVFILKNELHSLSDYTLEYSTALLMNLSLRKRGKDKWEDPNWELLHVLNELLEHENDQVRTYVNGTLYSIFRRKSLRQQAKDLGMEEILNYLAQNLQPHEEYLKRQIQYILGQLGISEGEEQDSSDEESDEEGDEEEEFEGDEDDEEIEGILDKYWEIL
jgi:LisH domain-containing protein ARMC9